MPSPTRPARESIASECGYARALDWRTAPCGHGSVSVSEPRPKEAVVRELLPGLLKDADVLYALGAGHSKLADHVRSTYLFEAVERSRHSRLKCHSTKRARQRRSIHPRLFAAGTDYCFATRFDYTRAGSFSANSELDESMQPNRLSSTFMSRTLARECVVHAGIYSIR